MKNKIRTKNQEIIKETHGSPCLFISYSAGLWWSIKPTAFGIRPQDLPTLRMWLGGSQSHDLEIYIPVLALSSLAPLYYSASGHH